jgi:hypothetical protein
LTNRKEDYCEIDRIYIVVKIPEIFCVWILASISFIEGPFVKISLLEFEGEKKLLVL